MESAPISESVQTQAQPSWLSARDIARALSTHKKRIHRTATKEQWPSRLIKGRLEYQPPPRITELVVSTPSPQGQSARELSVRFDDLIHDKDQRQNVLWREEAVLLLQNNLHLGKEIALQLVCKSIAA